MKIYFEVLQVQVYEYDPTSSQNREKMARKLSEATNFHFFDEFDGANPEKYCAYFRVHTPGYSAPELEALIERIRKTSEEILGQKVSIRLGDASVYV